jgi:hypothetical protein
VKDEDKENKSHHFFFLILSYKLKCCTFMRKKEKKVHMRWVLIIYLAAFSIYGIYSQSGFNTAGGAHFLGYARAGVTIEGLESVYLNQAGMADIQNWAVDASYERRFNIEGLDFLSLAAAKRTSWGTWAVSVTNFGLSEYNEQKFGLAYARRLHQRLSIGGQFNYMRYNIENLGSRHIFSFEAGMILRLHKSLRIGTHIFSPGFVEVAEDTDLPTRFRTGISYHPSDKVFLLVEADKSLQRQTEFKIALGYAILQHMHIRMGINPTLSLYSLGFQITLKDRIKMSGAVGLQNALGHSPAISFQYAR